MKWFVTLSLLTLALAGCTTDDQSATLAADGIGDDDIQGQLNETLTNNTNGTDAVGVPIINFTASNIVGNGTLAVEFTINVTDDDEVLDWTFMATNESLPITGFDFPATFTVTYEEGIHNATVWVDDGTNNVTTAIQITVGELYIPPPPEPVAEYTQTATNAAYPLRNNDAVAFTCPGFMVGEEGLGCATIALDGHAGMRAVISTTAGLIRGEFAPACSFGPSSSPSGFFGFDANEASINIPDSAGCILLWTSGNVGADFDWTVTIFE
jgi:hypothetical protein